MRSRCSVLASHSVTISNTGSFTITATDSSGGLGTGSETGVSNSFTVDPGALDHFLVEAAGGGAIGTQAAAVGFNQEFALGGESGLFGGSALFLAAGGPGLQVAYEGDCTGGLWAPNA